MKEYFKLKIMCKVSMKKRLDHFEELIKELYEITAGQQTLIDEYKKDSYRIKYLKEHREKKKIEKEANEIINELTAALRKAERENRKLKREMVI